MYQKVKKKNLEDKANEFINTELVNINTNKEQEMFSRINNILEQICNDIHSEFNINKKDLNNILNQHKFKLISNLETENIINDSDSDSDSNNDTNSDSNSDTNNNNKENIKSIEKNKQNQNKDQNKLIEKNKQNQNKDQKNDNNNVLTMPIKCPAAKKNGCSELCGRLTIKTCNYMYCGYHKKYFK